MNNYLAAVISVIIAGSIYAQPVAQVSSGIRTSDARINTFMEETMDIINTFREKTTSYLAHITLVRRVAGLTQFVSSDCRVLYRSPGYLSMDVKGINSYTVVISNRLVTTTFPDTQESDTRMLNEQEHILDDFLGIAGTLQSKSVDVNFKTEKNLYVVTAVMRPDERLLLTKDIVKNARTAVKRVIWVNPRTEQIVKTHVVTLGGDDTTLTFRDQWINTDIPEL
jgi:outer membrane lipoprotein-sorting protein